MKESTQTANAFVRGANLDTSMMYMGSIMSFLVRAQDTDGRFAMVEYRARPGNEPPPHVHLWEHEIYFVLEGKIEFHCGDQVETVGPGETIFLPAEKAHAFYIRSGYLRTLIITLATTEEPAALDSYFASMANACDQHGHPDRRRHLSHRRPVTCDRGGQEIRHKNLVA